MTFDNIKKRQLDGWTAVKNGKAWSTVSGAAGAAIRPVLDGTRSGRDTVYAAEQAARAASAG